MASPFGGAGEARDDDLDEETKLVRETEEASPHAHLDEGATVLEVLRYALTAGAMVRRGPAGALEAVAGHVALVRYATDRLTEFCSTEDPDDGVECQEIIELIRRNLSGIEGHARAAAKWFQAGGK